MTTKGLIVSAGVKLQDLAEASDIHPSTLTAYLNGTLRGTETRAAIWASFRVLAQSDVSLVDFWNPLDVSEAA